MCDLVKAGAYIETVMRTVGLERSTWNQWLAKGQAQPKSIFGEFVREIENVAGQVEAHSIGFIRQAGAKDWRAMAWFLERRFPKRWMRRQIVHVDNEDDLATDQEEKLIDGLVQYMLEKEKEDE